MTTPPDSHNLTEVLFMPDLPVKRKAFAYITHGDRLLVFDHADHPEAGTQVPAGTLEPGEDPIIGALREAFEESGLTDLEVVAVLGETLVDFSPWSRDELHHRTFVHLRLKGEAPDTWEHWEEHPDGSPAGTRYRFVFRWLPFDEATPTLVPGHGAFIDTLS